jgi:hypothetical protein
MLDEMGLHASTPVEGHLLVSEHPALPAIITPEQPARVLQFSEAGQPGPT